MSTTTTAMGSGSQCDRDRDEFTSIAERCGYWSDGEGEGERAARLPSVGQERTRAIAVASSSDLGLTE